MRRTQLFITHEFYPKRGGIATFVEELARAAASELGADVEVWAQALPRGARDATPAFAPSEEQAARPQPPPARPAPSDNKGSGAEAAGRRFPFRLWRLPLAGTHGIGCQLRLARELWRQRARLREASVYLVEPGPILTLMWLLGLGALRWLRPHELCLTFHGSEILRFYRHPLQRALLRRLIAQADRVSTLTHYTRDLLFERFPGARARWVLSPGALRHELSTSHAEAAAGPRRTAPQGSAARRLILLTVGRLHPRKGQLHTLAALAALPLAQQRCIEYWLVGSSSARGVGQRYAQQLRASAEAAAPELQVKFLGDVRDEQLAEIYAQADIFTLTSVPHGSSIEGFGLVYLEAAACGLPIVAHDIGGVSEAVCAEHNGVLVAPGDRAALSAAFARLIDDAALRARLGAAGPAWARRQSWRHSAAALLGLDSATALPHNAEP